MDAGLLQERYFSPRGSGFPLLGDLVRLAGRNLVVDFKVRSPDKRRRNPGKACYARKFRKHRDRLAE